MYISIHDNIDLSHDVNAHALCIFPQLGVYDESMSSFFRNVDARYDDPVDIPLGKATGKIKSLKARVRIDLVHLCQICFPKISATLSKSPVVAF